MVDCVKKQLLGFTLEDIPNILRSIEDLRLHLVRLNNRNRLLEARNVPIISVKNSKSTAGRNEGSSSKWYKIDEQGRKFCWMKKTEDLLDKIPSKTVRKRPTHRGKRKKGSFNVVILKKSLTTFSQLVPTATALPKGIIKLWDILFDTFTYMNALDDLMELKGIDPGDWLVYN